MRYALAVPIAFFMTCALAGAQSPTTKEAKIEEILKLTRTESAMEQVFAQTKAIMLAQMPADATTQERAKAISTQAKIMDVIRARMSWDKLRPIYVKMYSETFTETEIDGILGFYRSPAGRATVDKMPLVMAKSMEFIQTQMSQIMPEVMRIVNETDND
jgi:hypothetical protein